MMAEETKARIREMRAGGYSYRQVADDLQMKLETIKSFCRREREKAQKANTQVSNAGKSKSPGNGLCRYCGKRLVFSPGKRKKTFCNKACRSKYWTEHRDELPHNVTHTFTCQCCGKEFEIYGKRRKPCSFFFVCNESGNYPRAFTRAGVGRENLRHTLFGSGALSPTTNLMAPDTKHRHNFKLI